MSWLDDVTIEELNEPYKTLALELGLETTKRIAEILQGSQHYFPKLVRGCSPQMKAIIQSEFDGYNFKELAEKYGYTDRWIRYLVQDQVKKERSKPLENQMKIEDILDAVV